MTSSFRDPEIAQPDWSTATAAESSGGEQGLPDHQTEMAAGYRPSPSIAVQDATHGASGPLRTGACRRCPAPGQSGADTYSSGRSLHPLLRYR